MQELILDSLEEGSVVIFWNVLLKLKKLLENKTRNVIGCCSCLSWNQISKCIVASVITD